VNLKTFLIVVLILGSFSFSTSNVKIGGPGDDEKTKKKDTATAVVAYGQDYLFESAKDLSTLEFEKLMDSLLQDEYSSRELIQEINFYKSIQNKSQTSIYGMIDSMFELDSIPYHLVNQLNLFLLVSNLMLLICSIRIGWLSVFWAWEISYLL